MKTLAIATSLGLAALLGSTARAQQAPSGDPSQLPPVPLYGSDGVQPGPRIVVNSYPENWTPSPPPVPTVIEPPADDQGYDEEGYDIDYDLSYDTAAAENYDDGYDANAYQQFQQDLSPYGDWQDDPTYGEVWSPSPAEVGDDFSPYATGGHWVMTEYGWTWVSDWGWGWAPFHYGRWIDRPGHGWCWVPGSVWGPGWVGWRSGGGYVGWAPLPPRGVTVGAPRGVRSPWHFTLANELGGAKPGYLPLAVLPSVFAHTSVVTNLRTTSAGGLAVRFNAGPTAGGLRSTVRPVPLRTLAPRVLPRPTVTPRPGMPLQARPWFRGTPAVNSAGRAASIVLRPSLPGPRSVTLNARPMPLGARSTSLEGPRSLPVARPVPLAPSRPLNGTLTVVRPSYAPAPAYHYSAPAYHYSAPAYHYAAPAVHYSAPSYSAPAYQYAAPAVHYSAPSSYSAPAPAYHPTAPAAAPHFSAPAMGGGHSFSGGGGHHR